MFEIGREYDRKELLNFVGSKQIQSGIIWGNREPNCVIITSGGEHGINSGYVDTKNDDGSWDYTGQGSKGDQKTDKAANAIIINGQKDILIFEARTPKSKEIKERGGRGKLYRFEGIFSLSFYEFYVPKDGIRKNDRLLRFHLTPAKNVYEDGIIPLVVADRVTSLESLQQKILTAVNEQKQGKRLSVVEYRTRIKYVKDYALARAKGFCELCKKEAPFKSKEAVPFLEVHHILRLADDGVDLPENVAAICPNCHREAHFGQRREEIQIELKAIIGRKVRINDLP
ncbi:hypothetical protein GVN16_24220 [Emticicia sp. CRIBPO]|uniref:HNH endonuclease n=1 Tax=Emticicia sp. CRIBPO TaxID=2683258 RepID=UPI00141301F8|nr:HNH endonuclease signature motif containing protein [Emticicia sp. CRIBPO]NBA88903.1 hypothetical protein [Emticicia sp. CRIBPO]